MLTGEAKRDYQRKYMRTYMRARRCRLRLESTIVKTQTLPKPSELPAYGIWLDREFFDVDGNLLSVYIDYG